MRMAVAFSARTLRPMWSVSGARTAQSCVTSLRAIRPEKIVEIADHVEVMGGIVRQETVDRLLVVQASKREGHIGEWIRGEWAAGTHSAFLIFMVAIPSSVSIRHRYMPGANEG